MSRLPVLKPLQFPENQASVTMSLAQSIVYRDHEVTRDQAVNALWKFDETQRSQYPLYWYRVWAIQHDGKFYPPKAIWKLITNDFGKGGESESLPFQRLGFDVIRLTDQNRSQLELQHDHDGQEYLQIDEDRRNKVLHAINERRGQPQFRSSMMSRYHATCVVTGCKSVEVLEAAHINPYRNPNDHHPENGLLLRADIHTLFDLALLAINPSSMLIEVHPSIFEEYGFLDGKPIKCGSENRPSSTALTKRYRLFHTRR